jgi:metal-responsive CopG/Arc/MetJ family transcriptional regulator
MALRENYANIGVYCPKDFIQEIDSVKGEYYTRNKFILKILKENLHKYKQQNEILNGNLKEDEK